MPAALRSILVASVLLPAGCSPGDNASVPSSDDTGVVDVVATGLTLDAPEELPSGWTTFRLKNESGVVHFAIIERMPDGVGIQEQQEQLAPIFQEGMDLLNAGESDAAGEKFGSLPEWFAEIVFLGGPGFTSPGVTAQASVFLEPGTYLLECYVKTDGIFHSYNPDPSAYGMVHQFTVLDEPSGAAEPEATVQLTLSRETGITVHGELIPGRQTVAVHFEDQSAHEHFLGHDVHLARLSDDTVLDELASWMDWTRPSGLETPAPVEFLGGTHEMPEGATSYFTAVLEPGRYAWIAEVPGSLEKGMLKIFDIPSADDDM